jgi:microcystin-dependent protein
MAEPFLSEIRIFSFGLVPRGWAPCNGQLMGINQYQALFSLLGTTYGGDGIRTFALPNLQGRAPLHMGSGFVRGQIGGEQNHTLAVAEIPTHGHVVNASSTAGSSSDPGGMFLGGGNAVYGPATNLTTINPTAVSHTGNSQPHQNMQPYLTLNFCMALQGIFPSQN